jgi:precorrin-6Y C5,15-methyltransferase (decarboxylating)
VLSSDAGTPADIAGYLAERGFETSRLAVLEALGGAAERCRWTTAAGFDLADVQPLNLVALDLEAGSHARVIPRTSGLDDALFEHDGQMTRREIRAVTLSSLAPRPGERLWDIGCGAGSIAIEWLLAHPANSAIGIEQNAERAARAARNASALGVPRLQIVEGHAPAALADLPKPHAVFIGGGVHQAALIETAWKALVPGGRLVANVVTLQSERALLDAQARLGGTLLRLAVSRLDAVGNLSALRPAMAVTQWLAMKP